MASFGEICWGCCFDLTEPLILKTCSETRWAGKCENHEKEATFDHPTHSKLPSVPLLMETWQSLYGLKQSSRWIVAQLLCVSFSTHFAYWSSAIHKYCILNTWGCCFYIAFCTESGHASLEVSFKRRHDRALDEQTLRNTLSSFESNHSSCLCLTEYSFLQSDSFPRNARISPFLKYYQINLDVSRNWIHN